MRVDETLELLGDSDPAQGMQPPSREEIDRAFASILIRAQADRRVDGRQRRWLRPSVAAAGALAVAGTLAAFVVPFGASVGTQNAWARNVLKRATAFLVHSVSSPLYSDVTTITRGGAPVQRTMMSQAITWQYGNKMASTTWTLRPRREIEDSVFRGRRVEVFVAATNTIRESLNPPGGSISYSPFLPALLQLSPTSVARLHLFPGLLTKSAPSAVTRVMIALLHSQQTRVRRTTLDHTAVIRLSNPAWSGVIYLDPMTYAPREIYRTYVPGTASHGSQTIIINAYRTVKPSQLPRNLFNLRDRHPTARIRDIRP